MFEKALPRKNLPLFIIILLTAVYLIPRIPFVNKPLNNDEIYNTFLYLDTNPFSTGTMSAGLQGRSPDQPNWKTDYKRQIPIHPPLVSIFYYYWIRIFTDSEISLHIPPLIAGWLSLIIFYILGSYLVGEEIALAAGIVFNFSAAFIAYSTQAVLAAFELFCLLLSLLLLYRFLTRRNKTDLRNLCIINILSALTFYHYFVFLFGQTIIFFLFRKKLDIRLPYFIFAFSLFAIFASILTYAFLGNHYSGFNFWPDISASYLLKRIIMLPHTLILI